MRGEAIAVACRVLLWMPAHPLTFTVTELADALEIRMRTAYRIAHALCVQGVIEVASDYGGAEWPREYRRCEAPDA